MCIRDSDHTALFLWQNGVGENAHGCASLCFVLVLGLALGKPHIPDVYKRQEQARQPDREALLSGISEFFENMRKDY